LQKKCLTGRDGYGMMELLEVPNSFPINVFDLGHSGNSVRFASEMEVGNAE